MYICICNALNSGAVDQAIEDGAATPAQVYKALGAAPQCGKCKEMIRELLDERLASGMGALELEAAYA